MKPRVSDQKTAAMTLVEVFVVIAVLFILVAVLLPALAPRHGDMRLGICINNLKQIGLSYYIWANDNGGKFPTEISVTNGGTMEYAVNCDAVKTFQIMSNELSTPKVLYCPMDSLRTNAANFESITAKTISYFVGLDANTNHPQMFLSGDDNFAIGGVPVKSGLLELSTNAPIVWTAERHVNRGNIGLADGSVAIVTDSAFTNLLRQTGVATNRLAIP